jgi:preprotein translocase subunit Sec61beta
MAKKDKIYLPSGFGGLVRFPEEEEEKIKLKPEWVIYLIVGLIIIELLLKFLLV